MKKTRFIAVLVAVFAPVLAMAQTEPTFNISDPITLFPETETKEAALAINTTEGVNEVLFVTIDTIAIDPDPITGEDSSQAVTGFFYNPTTLTQIGDPFIVVGNPRGSLQKLTATYNPVNNKYFVAVAADSYSPSGNRVPLMAVVNPSSEPERIFKAWAWDEETTVNYQDTAVAASTNNGNLMYVSEYSPAEDSGEGVIGLLYDMEGNLLSTTNTRLDQAGSDKIISSEDEDDPDVYYLPENDIFLFISNTDLGDVPNRIFAEVIQPEIGADGLLQLGEIQIVSQLRKNFDAGHPSAIENPFTGEFIGALDYANGAEGGDLFYFNIGGAPDYVLTESQAQTPYLEAAGNNPFSQRHPRFAVDENSGVIVVSHNARDGIFQGMVFTLLGPDGQILPGRPDDLYKLVETPTAVSNDANSHDVKWDPNSDSFLIIYATGGGLTNVVRMTITSDHMPADVENWMTY